MDFRRLFSAFLLLFVFVGALATLPLFRFRSLVIHHRATTSGEDPSSEDAHESRFFDMAYHMILSNGSNNQTVGALQTGKRHFFLMNSTATKSLSCNLFDLHLCIPGNYEEGPVPDPMKVQMVSAIRVIQEKYHIPDDQIILHRDCGNTTCPGKYIDREKVKQWLQTYKPDAQTLAGHRAQIESDYLGPLPRGPLLVVLPVLFLLLVFRAPVPGLSKPPEPVTGSSDD